MKNLIEQLSKLSDSDIIQLVIEAKANQSDQRQAKTNRFGLYKKLPKGELDMLVEQAKALSSQINSLERQHGFTNNEIRKQILEMLNV